jgi:hypothetical protein
MEKIIIDGIHFRRYPNSPRRELREYYVSSATKLTGYKTKRLHRYIWEKQNGEIPKGMHIHHKDGNSLNNTLGNLELVTTKEHNQAHYQDHLATWRKNMDYARKYASEWHKSKAGKEFHKKISRISWDRKQLVTRECNTCKKEYGTWFPTRSKFCSGNCKATALRRRRGIRCRN